MNYCSKCEKAILWRFICDECLSFAVMNPRTDLIQGRRGFKDERYK